MLLFHLYLISVVCFQVGYVNFTWKSGVKKYYYNFDRLQSFDEAILEPPVISIKTKGRVPRRPKGEHIILSWLLVTVNMLVQVKENLLCIK